MADNPFAAGATGGTATPDNPFAGGGPAATAKKSGGGLLHTVARDSGAEFVGNLAKDIGSYGAGIGPGLEQIGKIPVNEAVATYDLATGNVGAANKAAGKAQQESKQVVTGTAKQYSNYYGHDILHHIYTHPLQPLLDALTVASGGAGAAARIGKIADIVAPESKLAALAKVGERGTITTRSPRAIATGKGPVQTDITSAKPIVNLRQQAVAKIRSKNPEGVGIGKVRVGGEVKLYGKQIQAATNQKALSRLTGLPDYQRATRRLSPNDWTALHIRAMDIHPDDLATLWKGTRNEGVATDPSIRQLVLHPTPKLLKAETAARSLSEQGAALYKTAGKLADETAAARPALTKAQASEMLGRPVKPITGDPYYFPHQPEPVKPVSPIAASGGGKGVPRRLGSMKQNTGALALTGKLHLRSDILGPEFLRRVKYVKYDEIHNALVRGAVRLTGKQIEDNYGGKLPKGYEYVREKASTKIPATLRGEGTKHVPLDHLIPNPDDLHGSALTEGFSTTDPTKAHMTGGSYHVIPTSTVKAATGEFTRSGTFTHAFVHQPLRVWRAAVLGLRAGFLTNNLVGNSVMYAVKTGGNGALRDLFGAIKESHGRETALKVLDSQSTPPGLRADLYKEFFPEQIQGTFGRTQSPSTSVAHAAGKKGAEGFRTVTGAIPKLTSKVAEEYPRRALIRNTIRNSPEFKKVYSALPKQTRSFEQAARAVLEGKGGDRYQRFVSKQVNQALGDYLNLSPFERNVLRNTLPFYSWYRAISTTSYHLAVDTPLRANILGQIGQIGKQWADKELGAVPSFLKDSIGLGPGKGGTVKTLTTQGLNPYATFQQTGIGGASDLTALGLNPFPVAALQSYAAAAEKQHTAFPKVSPTQLVSSALSQILLNLPPARLVAPLPPSKLYPTRDRKSQLLSFLGVPIKEYDPAVAAQQAAQGR